MHLINTITFKPTIVLHPKTSPAVSYFSLCFPCTHIMNNVHPVIWHVTLLTAVLWQKEASDKSDISCRRAKCVCHFHWRQWNAMMSYLTYPLAGWVFIHKIWPGRGTHCVKYKNINNSDLDVTCFLLPKKGSVKHPRYLLHNYCPLSIIHVLHHCIIVLFLFFLFLNPRMRFGETELFICSFTVSRQWHSSSRC